MRWLTTMDTLQWVLFELSGATCETSSRLCWIIITGNCFCSVHVLLPCTQLLPKTCENLTLGAVATLEARTHTKERARSHLHTKPNVFRRKFPDGQLFAASSVHRFHNRMDTLFHSPVTEIVSVVGVELRLRCGGDGPDARVKCMSNCCVIWIYGCATALLFRSNILGLFIMNVYIYAYEFVTHSRILQNTDWSNRTATQLNSR